MLTTNSYFRVDVVLLHIVTDIARTHQAFSLIPSRLDRETYTISYMVRCPIARPQPTFSEFFVLAGRPLLFFIPTLPQSLGLVVGTRLKA